MGCLGCLLWPLHLAWSLVGAVLSLIGHIFGAVLGILAFVLGIVLLFSMARFLLWGPLLVLGGLFAVRGFGVRN